MFKKESFCDKICYLSFFIYEKHAQRARDKPKQFTADYVRTRKVLNIFPVALCLKERGGIYFITLYCKIFRSHKIADHWFSGPSQSRV